MRFGVYGSRLVFAVSLLVVGGLMSNCTSTIITPEVVQPAPKQYQTLAIGEIGAADTLWEGRLPFMRRGDWRLRSGRYG